MGSENVAASLTALVISLIALIIALGQLLQQYLGTAEGYRRCAPSVIGPWAKLRRRKWIWSEFRFETRYVSPHIVCVTPEELEDLKSFTEHGRVIRVVSRRLAQDHTSQVLNRTVHYSPQARSDGPSDVRMPNSLGLDLEKAGGGRPKPGKVESRRHFLPEGDHSLSPSWIELIKHVHDLYLTYWPVDCLEGCRLNRRIDVSIPPSIYEDPGRDESFFLRGHPRAGTYDNLSRADAAIQFRTWTWDFMPPDLTKPLATSTVSDVILLGLRMGMDWRTLDPGNGKMAADGPGGSFQVFEIRGLGMVLKFTPPNTSQALQPLKVIPSRAVDKMLFGIIPGDPALVRRDVHMVKENRKMLNHPPQPTFEAIGLSPSIRARFRDGQLGHGVEINHETIALLCPFLNVRGCSEARIPSDLIIHARKGAFHFWEGRYGLFRALDAKDRDGSSALQQVHDTISWLESHYEADFYDRWGETDLENSAKGQSNRGLPLKDTIVSEEDIIAYCKEAHEKTYTWFRGRGFHEHIPSADGGRTLYVNLVAAHAYMAGHVLKGWDQRLEEIKQKKIPTSQEAWRERYDLPSSKYRYFVFESYEIAQRYVEHLHLVVNYMHEQAQQSGSTAREIEEAWWMLMLRGMLWDMSLLAEEGDARQPVPSSMFDNKTPVWII